MVIERPRGYEALGYLTRLSIRRRWEIFSQDERKAVGTILFLACMLMLGGLIHSVCMTIFTLLPEMPFTIPPEAMLAPYLLVGAMLALGFGFSRANDTLYLSGDLSLLMTLPLDSQWVMLCKTMWTLPATLGVHALLNFPAALAYARVHGWWPVLPVYLLGIPAISLATAALAVFSLVTAGRIATSTRIREGLGLIGAVLGMVLYFGWFTSMGMEQRAMEIAGRSLIEIAEKTGQFWLVPFSYPVTWPAAGLRFITTGRSAVGWVTVSGSLLLCLVLTWLLVRLQASHYVRTMASANTVSLPRRKTRTGRRRGGYGPPYRSLLGALMWRDWIIMGRNPRLWQTLIFPVGWICLMAFQNWTQAIPLRTLNWSCVGAGAAGYIGALMAPLALAFEGDSVYHLVTLPLTTRLRVYSKLLMYSIPPAVLALFMLLLVHVPAGDVGYLLPSLFLVAAGSLTGAAFGLVSAAEHTDFTSQQPWDQSRASGCAYILILLLVLLLAYGVLRMFIAGGEHLGVPGLLNETIASVIVALILVRSLVPYLLDQASNMLHSRLTGKGRPSQGT